MAATYLSIIMLKRPCHSRRILSQNGSGGLGSTDGRKIFSKHKFIMAKHGSQHGPYVILTENVCKLKNGKAIAALKRPLVVRKNGRWSSANTVEDNHAFA
uniref:Uncharacterized protein n=1 Tax=Romanomermis culicivorax TaxID=13658 RepID=A0A915IXU7_ROMCU